MACPFTGLAAQRGQRLSAEKSNLNALDSICDRCALPVLNVIHRGVEVRFVAVGQSPMRCDHQVQQLRLKHLQTCFLANFSLHRRQGRFTEFAESSWQGPDITTSQPMKQQFTGFIRPPAKVIE